MNLDREPSPATTPTLHGVDFSGGKDPHLKIWVATLEPGRPARLRRNVSHRDLIEQISTQAAASERTIWLIDSAFGLPQEMLEEQGVELRWEAMARWLAGFPEARDWRRACRDRCRKEHRRACDKIARTRLAPANLRLFRQTWHCIVSVLLPLWEKSDVAVMPFAGAEKTAQARAWVAEGCPSSLLQQRGWPHRGYKGPEPTCRVVREGLLERLVREEKLAIEEAARRFAVEDTEGDALDALLLLVSARRIGAGDPMAAVSGEPRAAVEGWVYV